MFDMFVSMRDAVMFEETLQWMQSNFTRGVLEVQVTEFIKTVDIVSSPYL